MFPSLVTRLAVFSLTRLIAYILSHSADTYVATNIPEGVFSWAQKIDSQMDRGDYHSGPLGYSENTAYQKSQDGKGFDDFKTEQDKKD